jgi:glycine cleavage system H lipoate-binding protein
LIVSVSRNASFLFDATIVDGEILYEDSNVWVTLSKEDILTFEITQVGSGEAGKGLVVTLSGKRLVA